MEQLIQALAPHLQRPADTVQPPTLRRTMAAACKKSSQTIEKDREAAEGLSAIGFGKGTTQGGRTDGSPARRLSQRLKQDHRLARIAMLAGKFKRIAAAKQKAKVRHGADEVSDVELGPTSRGSFPPSW